MFDLQTTAQDLRQFSHDFAAFVDQVPSDSWALRTGTREHDWTVHQTLAHLVSIGELLLCAAESARDGSPLAIEGLKQREDLRQWNETQIAKHLTTSPSELLQELTHVLEQAAQIAESTLPEQAQAETFVVVYNRTAPLRDLLDFQLSHAGVIHAAQITRPLEGIAPLWETYTPDFLARQLDRYLRHFSYGFWGNYYMGQGETLQFSIEGYGDYFVHVTSEGAKTQRGIVEAPDYHLQFSSPAALFGLFNVQLPIKDALQTGQLQVRGDWQASFRLIKLFSATPPNL